MIIIFFKLSNQIWVIQNTVISTLTRGKSILASGIYNTQVILFNVRNIMALCIVQCYGIMSDGIISYEL